MILDARDEFLIDYQNRHVQTLCMTRNEKRHIVAQVTQVVFNFLANRKNPDPVMGKWTRKVLREDLRDIIEDVSSDFGITKVKLRLRAIPEDDCFQISTLAIPYDTKADAALTVSVTWREFMESLSDSDPDEMEWWVRKFRMGAWAIERHLKDS